MELIKITYYQLKDLFDAAFLFIEFIAKSKCEFAALFINVLQSFLSGYQHVTLSL